MNRTIAWVIGGTTFGVLVAVAFVMSMPKGAPAQIPSILADTGSGPIFTSQDAIDRSLLVFPAHLSPNAPIAKLVKRITYLNMGRATPIAYTQPNVQKPHWIVAIRAVGGAYTSDLGIEAPGEGTPVDGFFFVWNASSGDLLEFGGLDVLPTNPSTPPPTAVNWLMINALQNDNVPITPEAPRPTLDLATGPPPP
jgi:hypothetical protein